MSNYLKYTALVFFGATGIAATEPASAQQAASAVEQGLEEIIVTARKRAEKLQDVPISITAFTADAIEQQGAQLLFQHVNAFADGRLCNVQSLGGSRKGSAIGDCHECSQILCVHAG